MGPDPEIGLPCLGPSDLTVFMVMDTDSFLSKHHNEPPYKFREKKIKPRKLRNLQKFIFNPIA